MRHLSRRHLFDLLNILKGVLVLALVLMFITFNSRIANEQAETQKIAQSTNSVVKGQQDILNAIKQVTDDTHTTAAQQTAIIICMLQVPIQERTTDLQAKCRSQSGATGTYTPSGTQQNSSNTNQTGSSSNHTPTSTPTQPNTSQNPPSGGSSQPGFFQRNVVQPIKDLVNAL